MKILPVNRFTLPALAFTLLTLGAVSSAWAQGSSELVLAALERGVKHAPNEVLVQYRRAATDASKAKARGRVKGISVEVVVVESRRNDGGGTLELTRLPPGLAIADAVRSLEGDPAVEFAEPNWIYFHDAVSNDTYYTGGQLWGMYGDATAPANPYGSQAGEAWAANHTTDCGDVYIGIIDEGYMYTHVDLAANAGVNPGEISGNGVDDDGNGRVDDVYGWDFYYNNNSVFDGTADDHGTHVAGTIGGVGGNGIGVAGVCWSVKLLDAKFLGPSGGSTANAIKAVDYFTDLKTRHSLNLIATSNSWGGGGYSQGLADAIGRANNAGILFVAAAGNSSVNNDVSPHYPSSYTNPNVIAVASITSTGAMSSFSNYGATSVDIGAPGSGIYSTLPGSNNSSTYGSYSGTSMATPHVTGAAAMLKALCPAWSHSDIRNHILATAATTLSLVGKTVTGGRLDIGAAAAQASCAPPPPPDNAPAVTIKAPGNGVTVGGTVTVTAEATDDVGVKEIALDVDDQPLYSCPFSAPAKTASCTTAWDTTVMQDGSPHTISARATDRSDKSGSASVGVIVQNGTVVSAPIHVGTLSGTGSSINKKFWRANVTVKIVDEIGHGVSNATVTSSWTGGYAGTSTCITAGGGTCTVTSGNVRNSAAGVTLEVTGVTASDAQYDSTANPDDVGNPAKIEVSYQ